MPDPSRQRRWSAQARTTDTFGRVLCNTRDQHFVVDGPVQNGCPGEAATPGELFLTSIAACGVELIEVFARQEEVPLSSVYVEIAGELDLDDPVRSDFTVFRTVALDVSLGGVTREQAEHLVERFQGRCPLYGSMAVATPDVTVSVTAEP